MVHAVSIHDGKKDMKDHLQDNEFQVFFPSMLDPDMLVLLRDQGLMTHEKRCEAWSTLLGNSIDDYAEDALDPVTCESFKSIEKKEKAAESKEFNLNKEKVEGDISVKKSALKIQKDSAAQSADTRKRKAKDPTSSTLNKSNKAGTTHSKTSSKVKKPKT